MRLRKTFLAAGALVLMMVPAGAGAATGVSYRAAGSYSVSQCENQTDCTSTYSYTGTTSCAPNCVAGAPTEGTFTLSLTGSPLHPPSPCISKRVQGTLQVTWSDSTTTTTSLTGKAHQGGYALKGTITDSTNPFLSAGLPVTSFVNHPPSPCSPGAFTGSLEFSQP